jgi:excisionase family DNA binding protein
MSPEEPGQFLGIGRPFAYRLLSEGEIPSVRLGRLRKVRRTDAEKFVEERSEGGRDARE